MRRKAANSVIGRLSGWLDMGRFHHLLPADVGQAAILKQLNLPQFGALCDAAIVTPMPQLHPQLQLLAQ